MYGPGVSTRVDSGRIPMSCPGPHQLCPGCGGAGTVPTRVLGMRHGRPYQAQSTTQCRPCQGRGDYCRAEPRCGKPGEAITRAVRPEDMPPA